jgi:superfamily I DNA/RNA helicase/SOS-response transcriptional repressor LexA
MQLNSDQKRIVESPPGGHSLIKGVAGSGKTTIGIARLNFLKNHYCMNEDKILFATYNKTLINYSKKLFELYKSEELSLLSLDSDKNVELKTVDSLIWKYFKKHYKNEYTLVSKKEQYAYLSKAMSLVSDKYDTDILSDKNMSFLLEELEWIKESGFRLLDEYLSVDRLGRGTTVESGPSRLRKNSDDRKAIHELLVIYEKLMKKDKKITFSTMGIRVQDLFLKDVMEKNVYQHIVIDESQDLSKVQLNIISFIFDDSKKYSSIMFLADTTQSIYMKSWLSPVGRSFKSIGFDMSGKSKILSRNYRTTKEIAYAAYSLVEHDENILSNENYVKPVAIEKTGKKPLYLKCDGISEQYLKIKELIQEHLSDGVDYSDIAIVSKTWKSVEDLKDYLNNNGVPALKISKRYDKLKDNAVHLLSMHSIKGLEYDIVFAANLNKSVIPFKSEDNDLISRERKLLYVAMTRAKKQLYLMSSDEPSPFIKEINHKYLRKFKADEKLEFYKVPINDYYFVKELMDQFSVEESVRQWFIDLLIKKQGFSIDQLSIEFPVQLFSKKGYVDIAVKIDNKPYIFVEIKPYADHLEKAINQLKSYLEVNQLVKYGIVSNGKKIRIFEKTGYSIDEIFTLPDYKHIKGDYYNTYKYLDLINHKNYEVKQHLEDKDMILLKDLDEESMIETESAIELVSYGEVAAGQLEPVFNDKSIITKFPDRLLKNQNEYFLLEVNGKSMIDVGIEPGNYVVVKKQSYANNRDIVVAVVEQTSTLKRYSPMNDKILLIPENSSYEPIMVDEEELYINGVVVGVLKKD